jgi:hypothetical protein
MLAGSSSVTEYGRNRFLYIQVYYTSILGKLSSKMDLNLDADCSMTFFLFRASPFLCNHVVAAMLSPRPKINPSYISWKIKAHIFLNILEYTSEFRI